MKQVIRTGVGGQFGATFQSEVGIHVKILLISLIHPFLNFISLMYFEYWLCAKDWIQHSQCLLGAHTVTVNKDGRAHSTPWASKNRFGFD